MFIRFEARRRGPFPCIVLQLQTLDAQVTCSQRAAIPSTVHNYLHRATNLCSYHLIQPLLNRQALKSSGVQFML